MLAPEVHDGQAQVEAAPSALAPLEDPRLALQLHEVLSHALDLVPNLANPGRKFEKRKCAQLVDADFKGWPIKRDLAGIQ